MLNLFIKELAAYKISVLDKKMDESGNLDIGKYSHQQHIGKLVMFKLANKVRNKVTFFGDYALQFIINLHC